jgi:O-antigen/teichoic acid export membrane protein
MSAQMLRLAKGAMTYGVGAVLSRALGLLLLPLFTRLLTPRDYGIAAVIGTVLAGASGLLSLGTGNSLGVLYFEARNDATRPAVIWTNVALLSANCLVLCGVGALWAGSLSWWLFRTLAYADLIRIALATAALATIVEPLYAQLRMEEKARAVVVLSVVETILSLGLSIYLVAVLHRGIRGLFESTLLAKALMFVLMFGLAGRRLCPRFDLHLIAPLVRIGVPSIFGATAFFVVDYCDRLMLQGMTSTETVGLYAVGYNFGMIMLLFVGGFGSAWPPYFLSFIDRQEDARAIFGKVFTYYLAAFGGLALVFFAAARPVVALLTAPAFHAAYSVVGLVAMAYMLKGCYLILLPGVYFKKKLYLQTVIEWAAAFLNIALNLALIPSFGKDGAAWATLLSYVSLPVSAYFISRRYLSVRYEWRPLGALLGGLLVTALALLAVSAGPLSAAHLALAAALLIAFAVFVVRIVLGESEREFGAKLLGAALRLRA